MKIAIVYDSETGNTQAAAEQMGELARRAGHECSVESWEEAHPALVSEADLVCVGSWVQGLLVVGQHPSARSLRFIDRLGDLRGRPAAVFVTYRVAAGRSLDELARHLEARGARVTGRFKSRGAYAAQAFESWIRSLPTEAGSGVAADHL
jgi:flavodoxin